MIILHSGDDEFCLTDPESVLFKVSNGTVTLYLAGDEFVIDETPAQIVYLIEQERRAIEQLRAQEFQRYAPYASGSERVPARSK
jgi:hypothetical protein